MQTLYDSVFTETVFRTIDNQEIQLSQFAGKVVVFDFWETWCGPCIHGFKSLTKAIKKFPDDFVVIAVNSLKGDTEEVARKFVNENDYDFIFVYSDGVFEKLNGTGIPFKVFFDPEGKYITHSTGLTLFPTEYSKLKKIIKRNRLKSLNSKRSLK